MTGSLPSKTTLYATVPPEWLARSTAASSAPSVGACRSNCLEALTPGRRVSSVLDMSNDESFTPGSPEHRVALLLREKGVDKYDAGNLAFDLVNATAFVESAEDGLRSTIERRERLIRQAAEAGLSYREIAKIVDLSYQRIAQIVTGGETR